MPSWRPFPLRPHFLVPFTVLNLLVIGLLEVLYHLCTPHGCPVVNNLVYNYLPTTFTVCYGLLVALVHHDSVRMEPWFGMSAVGGAGAEDSVLLEYQYMLPVVIPVVAFRKRHYTVLLSSMFLLLSTFFTTPLAAGLFEAAPLTSDIPASTTFPAYAWGYTPEEMSTSEDPIAGYSGRHDYLAYARAWLNGSLPAFTTPTYALSPWDLPGNTTSVEEEWTGETILYEAELVCEAAIQTEMAYSGIGYLGVNLTSPSYPWLYLPLWDPGVLNATDYVTMMEINEDPDLPAFDAWEYTKYADRFDTGADYYLLADLPQPGGKTNWTDEMMAVRKNSALFVFADASPPIIGNTTVLGTRRLPSRISAIFCQPEYRTQPAQTTVSMPSGRILNTTRMAAPTTLNTTTTASILNDLLRNDLSGYLRAAQKTPLHDSNGYLVGLGSIPQTLIDSTSQVSRRFGAGRVQIKQTLRDISDGGLGAFVLSGATNDTLVELFDETRLAALVSAALKLKFALLCTDTWIRSRIETSTPTTIIRTRQAFGFILSSPWCRAAQSLFALLALLTATLALALSRRRSNLPSDPGSLSFSISLLSRSPAVVQLLRHSEFHTASTLATLLRGGGGQRFALTEDGSSVLVDVDGGADGALLAGRCMLAKPTDGDEVHAEETQWPVSAFACSFFGFFFGVMVVLGCVLCAFAGIGKGLPLPSPPSELPYKLLYTYIPTLLATSTEPLLVSLASHTFLLAPYLRLLPPKGPARAKTTLLADYTRRPPHWQLIRAVRNGEWTLASLSISIWGANILAVSLAALFTLGDREASGTVMAAVYPRAEFAARTGIWDDRTLEAMYLTYATVSNDTGPLSWIYNDRYVFPPASPLSSSVSAFSSSSNNMTAITLPTTSLRARTTCEFIEPDAFTYWCTPDFVNSTQNVSVPCGGLTTPESIEFKYGALQIDDPCWESGKLSSTGGANGTFLWRLPAADYMSYSDACPDTVIAVWAEMPAAADGAGGYDGRIDVMGLKCTMEDVVERVSVGVDEAGMVKSVKLEAEAAGAGAGAAAETALTAQFLNATRRYYQQTAKGLQLSWFDATLAVLHESTASPPDRKNLTHIPDASTIIPSFQDVFSRVFVTGLRVYSEDMVSPGPLEIVEATLLRRTFVVEVRAGMMAVAMTCVVVMGVVVALVLGRRRAVASDVAHVPRGVAAEWVGVYALAERWAGAWGGWYAYGEWEGGVGVYEVGDEEEAGAGVEGGKGTVGVTVGRWWAETS